MFLIDCPNCGSREASEFLHGGEDAPRPASGESLTGEQWAAYLYMQENRAAVRLEWWFHDKGCAEWLVVERDAATNVVHKVRFHEPDAP